MPDRLEAETLFLTHLDWIKRAARKACSQDNVQRDETEDFVSQVMVKLMDDDYAVIRNHRGESALKTYLTLVIARQFVEHVRQRRGRWRPSAAALRIGPPAPALEKLVHQQGYSLQAAGEKLRTSRQTGMSDIALARLLEKLPRREPLRPVQVPPDTVLDSSVDPSRADEHVTEAESTVERSRVTEALSRVLEAMDPEDRVIAQMRFVDGYTVADIARLLEKEQKKLYRRVDGIRSRMRLELEKLGVRWTDVDGMMNDGEDA